VSPLFSKKSLIASTLVGVVLGVGLFILDSQMSRRFGQFEIGIAFGSPNKNSDSESTTENDFSVTQSSSTPVDETEATSPTVSSLPGTTVPLPANIDQTWRERLILLTNQEREKVGLGPLQACPTLHSSAQAHAFAMSDQDFFEHENPFTGDDPSIRGEQAGYGPYVGENIALGYESPKAVTRGWMNSPGHRENILGDYRHLGIGIYLGRSSRYGNGIYWVQNFGSSGDCG
jgi:uncharacterized protein YkwD